MPAFIQNPIPAADLDYRWLADWDHAERGIAEAINQDKTMASETRKEDSRKTVDASQEDVQMDEPSIPNCGTGSSHDPRTPEGNR